jgi:hypothetical protein
MKFEVKNIETLGGVMEKNSDYSMQMFSVSVGVVGCPYNDMISNKIVEYTFANNITYQDVKDGITSFIDSWVESNYPEVA